MSSSRHHYVTGSFGSLGSVWQERDWMELNKKWAAEHHTKCTIILEDDPFHPTRQTLYHPLFAILLAIAIFMALCGVKLGVRNLILSVVLVGLMEAHEPAVVF
jgi:hypothetical protein